MLGRELKKLWVRKEDFLKTLVQNQEKNEIRKKFQMKNWARKVRKRSKLAQRRRKYYEQTFWGGYHAYFADLDGYYWEVAWGPDFKYDENGMLKF